jgi:hypothetical protein
VHEDRPHTVLEYESPGARRSGLGARLHAWFRPRGEDTFLGSASLLFALCQLLFFVVEMFSPGMACAALPAGMLAVALAVGAFVERGSSKMFPAVALGIVILSVILLLVVFPLFR